MTPTDRTIEILREIRDAVRVTNGRLDATNERLDATNERLERNHAELSDRLTELSNRMTETEVRLATEIVALNGTVIQVRDLLRDHSLRDTVADHDRRIASLEQRVG